MTRDNNHHKGRVTYEIIRKIHLLLADTQAGEDIIDYLRATQPIFMKEVGRYVSIELEKLQQDFEEDFCLYIGSVVGAAYIMGFLIAREVDHRIYDGVLNFESLLENKNIDTNYVDKLIDNGLSHGKKPKEIGEMVKKHLSRIAKGKYSASKPGDKLPHKLPRKIPRPPMDDKKIDINLDENDL